MGERARAVALIGPNGAGKTNILEAISFLAPGRGLRRARLTEIGRRAPGGPNDRTGKPWAVAARLTGPEGWNAARGVDIGTGVTPDAPEKRAVRIDGEPQRAQSILSEYVAMHWLTPRMDGLFIEGAPGRRRFLDRLIYGRDPAHAGRVSAYEHAMRERLKLLRNKARADVGWLAALESAMAAGGVAIATARLDAAAALAGELDAMEPGPFPAADLGVEGDVESWVHGGSALAAEDRLRETLAANRTVDGDNGRTAAGPHRSDLRVFHREKNQPAEFCSTGEQKALLISLVLAQAQLEKRRRGWAPILLLDEVAAHLDRARRQALFDTLLELGCQVWVSGADLAPFEPLTSRAVLVRVEDAVLTIE